MIPDQADWTAIFMGCLNQLIYPFSFEPYGTATPDETAEFFRSMFDDVSFQTSCRMIGEIIPYAGSTSPNSGWLLCDGSSLVRADYPDLFAVIGTNYGSVDSTHFNLPDLRGRAPIGEGSGVGLSPRTIGDQIGEETHQLVLGEIPSHDHAEITATATAITIGAGAPAPSALPGAGVTGAAGGNGAHENMQPSLVINFLIVALP